MAYLKVIEESTTWTCPKTADYKVICVAGGCAGGMKYDTSDSACVTVEPEFGEPTSFGDYLTASGSINGRASADIEFGNVVRTGPLDGFSLHNSTYGRYREKASDGDLLAKELIAAPKGYGAGGNTIIVEGTTSQKFYVNSVEKHITKNPLPVYAAHGGSCGKLIMEIINIAAGTEVVCTVGRSVYLAANAEKNIAANNYGKYTYGNDGVIVIQEV